MKKMRLENDPNGATHFICLTIVLLPDSPAPAKQKKDSASEMNFFRGTIGKGPQRGPSFLEMVHVCGGPLKKKKKKKIRHQERLAFST
jgi:hypothetical protein